MLPGAWRARPSGRSRRPGRGQRTRRGPSGQSRRVGAAGYLTCAPGRTGTADRGGWLTWRLHRAEAERLAGC